MPAIQKATKQAQEAFSKVDTKQMQGKIQQAVQFVKKKMQDLKKSTQNNEIAIKVNNKDAEKQITQLQKEIDSLQKKITGRQMKLDIINPQIDQIVSDTRREVTPQGINHNSSTMDSTVNNALSKNKDFSALNSQAQKLYTEIETYNKQLSEAKSKMAQLGQQTSQTATTQNKLSSFFNAFKGKIEQTKPILSGIKTIFSQIPKITQKITNNIKGMGKGLKQGLGHVLKYAGALFSLRGIYSVLSNSASSWLSSQNSGAQQLSANIDYMKYAMGSALAPAIQFVTNLVYQLMKAIQSVVYALTGVNIFANASSKAYSAMAGNAKKAKQETKQLAGIHDEINNVQNSDNSDSGSDGSTSPSFDLSGIDSQMSPMAQKLYDFFKPLKESWDIYGNGLLQQLKVTAGQIGGLISSLWGSVEKIIVNGTVYKTLELILAIIGNIAEAFSNAWNYNGNGDAIVQNLANAFNNLLTAINNVVQNQGFQDFLNNCSDKFRIISEKIAEIDWQPLIEALSSIGQNIGAIALDILSGFVDIFKWLVENPTVAEIILAIAVAIGVVSSIIGVVSSIIGVISGAMTALTAISTALNIALLPLIGIIAGIIAVIALIIVAIMNWDSIVKALKDTWEWIKQKAQEIWNAIGDFFKNLWQGMKDTVSNIWNGIKDFLSNIFNNIKNTAVNIWNNITTTISNVINKIKNTISNILNAIKTVWNNIWNGIKTVVTNVWNGIWSTIKGVINKIIGGVESFVNTVIRGINKIIEPLAKVGNTILQAVGITNFSFSVIPSISLPRLAKGGVLTQETAFVGGEYLGARSNPEIVTPQNIMYDTMRRAMSDSNFSNGQPVQVTVQYLGKTIYEDTIEYINGKTRRTGKNTIVTVEN